MRLQKLFFKKAILFRHFCLVLWLILGITNRSFGQWTRKADELSQRAECNNVLYQNKVYVFSGFGNNPVIEKTNEVYDIATNKWSKIASFPSGKEVTHQGVLLVDDEIWIIGGRAIGAYGPASSKVLIYHITTNTWTDGPELIDPSNGKPFPMGGGGYILLGRTIHVFGGFGPTLCVDQATLHLTLDVDKYRADHTTAWENKLAPLPIPRNHISYVVLAGKIYVFGGQFLHDCGAADQNICHVYDPLTDKWTRIADLPVPRSHAEAATFAVDGKVFLVGGQGKGNISQNTVYQYTPQAANGAGSWSLLSAYKLPGNYLGLSSKISGKSFIITNGALDVYSNERKETYIANVNRSNNRTLGFSAPCLSLSSVTGQEVTLQNLLYVVEEETTYNVTTDAQWLTVTNNSGKVNLNGTVIQLTMNTAGLLAGNYTAIVTATGALAGSKASFCVNLTVLPVSGYSITVTKNGSGTVTQTPFEPVYSDSSRVTINATAAAGWLFKGWSGDTVATENPLMLTINKNIAIKADFIPDSNVLINNIKAKTTSAYAIGTLVSGTNYYTDRDYTIKSVPDFLINSPFIKTANNDKTINSTTLLTFNLNRAATIFVAYDSRAVKLPAWLSGWTKITDKLLVSDAKLPAFILYKKYFAAGTASLGSNMASPATGALCQYLVIALEDTTGSNLVKVLSAGTFSSQLAQTIDHNLNTFNDKNGLIKPFIYPNPVQTNLQIVFPDSYPGPTALRLISMTGLMRNLSNSVFRSHGNVVDVSLQSLGLRQGTYALYVTYGNGKVYVVQFVKE